MNNYDRWLRAKFTRSTQIDAQAAKIEANRARYEAVSMKTGVPWCSLETETIFAPFDLDCPARAAFCN